MRSRAFLLQGLLVTAALVFAASAAATPTATLVVTPLPIKDSPGRVTSWVPARQWKFRSGSAAANTAATHPRSPKPSFTLRRASK